MRKIYIIQNLDTKLYFSDRVRGNLLFISILDVNNSVMEFDSEDDAFSYMKEYFDFENGYYIILPVVSV